jgi:hypothetical protein
MPLKDFPVSLLQAFLRRITIHTVISLPKKSVSFTLVEQPIAFYLCSQKLIGVQQTLIELSKSIEKYRFP